MKRIVSVLFWILTFNVSAQISGTLQVPSTYTSLATVISALNQQGVSGPVIVSVAAGYTETVPSGGFSLTATGTVSAPVIFQKSGSGPNPKIYAYAGGSGTPGSTNQDGIWRFIGSDFITVDGFELIDTNTIHPRTMEFGFGFFKVNGLDGCQNNTIKNCVVRLCRFNNASGTAPAGDGSRAINLVNAGSGAQTTSLTVFAASGSNSFNRFYANTFQECNIGVYLSGYADVAPFGLSDHGNDIGGGSALTGNTILDFGGGSSGNVAIGIKTLAQYDLNVSNNTIKNNTGQTLNHTAQLKGISIGLANGANSVVRQNTVTLQGGGVSSALTLIENASGNAGNSNTISICNNHLINCSYSTAVNAPFFGIYNTASCLNLLIDSNQFSNNSTSGVSGNTYLIYNTGSIPGKMEITGNALSQTYDAVNSYSGALYGIYNTASALTSTLSIKSNYFSSFKNPKASATGNWYFIYNNADCAQLAFENNKIVNLHLNHSGAEYFFYNASSTQSLLSVCNNSVIGVKRSASTGNTYCYYAAANSAGTAVQTFSGNVFSDIKSPYAGSGNFYGIYNAEGNASPYPKKIIHDNTLENIFVNGTGTCYGIYATGMGDAGTTSGSLIYNNKINNIGFGDAIYGLYSTGAGSTGFPASVSSNTLTGIYSLGANAPVYGAYIGNSSAGIHFFRNLISDVSSHGTAGIVNGVYCVTTSTTHIYNNLIANLNASVSIGSNRVNGIYLNSGTNYQVYYNTVFLSASSTASLFGTNALYASTTTSLTLKNNILVNLSVPLGAGISAAYRRSSTNLASYLAGSDNNLFYAGVPTSSTVIFYNGSSSYQSLSAFQTAMSNRDQHSVSQNPVFLSQLANSAYFLHLSSSNPNLAESGGSPITGVTIDYDLQSRQGAIGYIGSGTAPDIGADEIELNLTPCGSVVPASIVSSTLSVCVGQTCTLQAGSFGSGSGYTYQWKVAQQSGGPYQSISGANGIELVTASFSAGSSYFVLETVCSVSSLSALSNEIAVSVHSSPIANPQISTTVVCAGSPLAFTSSSVGIATWEWEGPNGFYSSAQDPFISSSYSAAAGVYSLSVSSAFCSSPVSTLGIAVSDVLFSTVASSSFLCVGASSTLTALGAGLTFSWSNGAPTSSVVVSPSVGTVYTVIATNSLGCSARQSVTVSVINPTVQVYGAVICQTPAVVSLSVNAFNASTINWYVSLTSSVILGSGNIYTLNPSSDTTLYVVASDLSNGCISQRTPVSVTLSAFPSLTVSASQLSVCPGKMTTLSVTGASSYTWSGLGSGSTKTVSPLQTTTYTVTGKNLHGCLSQATLEINAYPVPIVQITTTNTLICPSSAFVVLGSGANSYTWSNGTIAPSATLFPPSNTTYTVYGSNIHNCIATATISVKTLSVPVVSISSSTNSVCPGELVVLSANGAITYTWLPTNQTGGTSTVYPETSSVFNAIGISVNGCTAVAFFVVSVEPCTGFKSIESEVAVRVFPNPARNVLRISGLGEKDLEYRVEITDITSQLLFGADLVLSGRLFDLEISAFPPGIYYLRISNADSGILIQRFVKLAD